MPRRKIVRAGKTPDVEICARFAKWAEDAANADTERTENDRRDLAIYAPTTPAFRLFYEKKLLERRGRRKSGPPLRFSNENSPAVCRTRSRVHAATYLRRTRTFGVNLAPEKLPRHLFSFPTLFLSLSFLVSLPLLKWPKHSRFVLPAAKPVHLSISHLPREIHSRFLRSLFSLLVCPAFSF